MSNKYKYIQLFLDDGMAGGVSGGTTGGMGSGGLMTSAGLPSMETFEKGTKKVIGNTRYVKGITNAYDKINKLTRKLADSALTPRQKEKLKKKINKIKYKIDKRKLLSKYRFIK